MQKEEREYLISKKEYFKKSYEQYFTDISYKRVHKEIKTYCDTYPEDQIIQYAKWSDNDIKENYIRKELRYCPFKAHDEHLYLLREILG
jgi:hypothetical protein